MLLCQSVGKPLGLKPEPLHGAAGEDSSYNYLSLSRIVA
jgi:hypothetical protein